jgi:hypothetical protein
MVTDATGAIVGRVIEQAKAGDAAATEQFLKYLLPKHAHQPRVISPPISLPKGDSLESVRKQIASLARQVAAGRVDIEAAAIVARILTEARDVGFEHRFGAWPSGPRRLGLRQWSRCS